MSSIKLTGVDNRPLVVHLLHLLYQLWSTVGENRKEQQCSSRVLKDYLPGGMNSLRTQPVPKLLTKEHPVWFQKYKLKSIIFQLNTITTKTNILVVKNTPFAFTFRNMIFYFIEMFTYLLNVIYLGVLCTIEFMMAHDMLLTSYGLIIAIKLEQYTPLVFIRKIR